MDNLNCEQFCVDKKNIRKFALTIGFFEACFFSIFMATVMKDILIDYGMEYVAIFILIFFAVSILISFLVNWALVIVISPLRKNHYILKLNTDSFSISWNTDNKNLVYRINHIRIDPALIYGSGTYNYKDIVSIHKSHYGFIVKFKNSVKINIPRTIHEYRYIKEFFQNKIN